jgi:DNA-binding transcriptional ArsR family regulator
VDRKLSAADLGCASYHDCEDADKLTPRSVWSILSLMENRHKNLDRTFAALGDPTRRAILGSLARRASATVSELAAPFAIKLPAVMKHLGVLDEAGLITRSKSGRVVTVRLRPESMREAMAWLQSQERFWSRRLDKLTAYAERKEMEARSKK